MLIVHVYVHVRQGQAEAFRAATLDNARHSVEEPGIVRFDLLHQEDDEHRFLLIEVFREPEDVARHKETAHYARWRDAVESMMVEPRRSVKYAALFPDDARWELPR